MTIAMTAIGLQVLRPVTQKLTCGPLEFDFICGIYDVLPVLMVCAGSPLTNPLVYRDPARFRAFAETEARSYAAAAREFGPEEN
jgi:hypothetical protein